MFTATYTCDECGAVKKEANHWFALRKAKDCSQIFTRLEIRAFKDGIVDDIHICGESCLIKRVSVFADDLNFDAQEAAHA